MEPNVGTKELRSWHIPEEHWVRAKVLGNTLLDNDVPIENVRKVLIGPIACFELFAGEHAFTVKTFWTGKNLNLLGKVFDEKGFYELRDALLQIAEEDHAIRSNYSDTAHEFYRTLQEEFGCAQSTAFRLVAKLGIDTLDKLLSLDIDKDGWRLKQRQVQEVSELQDEIHEHKYAPTPTPTPTPTLTPTHTPRHTPTHTPRHTPRRVESRFGAQSNPYLIRVW